jgi:hypothetical protein
VIGQGRLAIRRAHHAADRDADLAAARRIPRWPASRRRPMSPRCRLLDGADAEAVPLVQKAIVAAVDERRQGDAASSPSRRCRHLRTRSILTCCRRSADQEARPPWPPSSLACGIVGRGVALTRWTGTDAIERLLALAANGDTTYRNQAFSASVRQVGASSLPSEQKLLQFRRPCAVVDDGRSACARALGGSRPSRASCSSCRSSTMGMAGEAAGSLMRIALPSASDAADGLSGTIVRDALAKAMPLVTGPQRDADRARIAAYLAAMPAGDGFVPLFNGRDLSGWQGLVENPIGGRAAGRTWP